MKKNTNKTTIIRRSFLSVIVLLLLMLIVWLLSMLLSYFYTGAEWGTPEAYQKNTLIANAPEVEWVNTVPENGFQPDSFLQLQIAEGYLKAWQALNYCYKTKNTNILKDHFAETQWDFLNNKTKEQAEFQVEQADLSHHLNLTTLSLDKQVVAFKDSGVKIKKKIRTKDLTKTIYSDIQEADFDVVMTLDDGNWRIRHFKRRDASPAKDTLIQQLEKMVKVEGKQLYIKEQPFRMAGVNYYPMDTPWFDFWTEFDSSIINNDMEIIENLGLNTIRIFVFYELFGRSEVKAEMLSKMDTLLSMAQEHNLKVVVTLFDFLPSYEVADYAPTEKHLKKILQRYKGHPAILAWDLKNEPDLDFENHGRQTVLEWLDYMLGRAKVYDPTHPVTIGWSSAKAASQLHEEVDFVSFHFYEDLALLSERLEKLQFVAGDKPVLITEFGLPSFKSIFPGRGHSETEQADHYQEVLKILEQHEPAAFISWTLYDFPQLPGNVFGGPFWRKKPQKHFGLIRTDKQQKPAAKVIIDWCSRNSED
jgi:hypothetical protein